MNRYTPRNSEEFEARQKCFNFGARARRIAAKVGNTIREMKKWLYKELNKPLHVKPPHQLVLELDGLAQIPMRF